MYKRQVIFHEACGHGLEATAVARNASVFAGKLGEKIASDIVTAVDDGTIQNAWGSLNIDDEGTPCLLYTSFYLCKTVTENKQGYGGVYKIYSVSALINKGYDQRDYHKKGLGLKYDAHKLKNKKVIHTYRPPFSNTLLSSTIFEFLHTIITLSPS